MGWSMYLLVYASASLNVLTHEEILELKEGLKPSFTVCTRKRSELSKSYFNLITFDTMLQSGMFELAVEELNCFNHTRGDRPDVRMLGGDCAVIQYSVACSGVCS